MRGTQVPLACVMLLTSLFLYQQPAAAQQPRPGSTRVTLRGALQTLGPSLRARSSAPFREYVDSIKNPPKPPSTIGLLQPYITDLTGNPVSTDLAEANFVTIQGKTALQLKLHSTSSPTTIIGQGATIKLPDSPPQTITDTTELFKYNFKVDADTAGHKSSAETFAYIYVLYSTPPAFTDTQFAVSRNLGFVSQPTAVLEPDGSYTITFKRTNFLVYPNYILGSPYIPSGSRIKKIGFSANSGFNDATITWTIKDVLLNKKPVGADVDGLHYDSPFQPYKDY